MSQPPAAVAAVRRSVRAALAPYPEGALLLAAVSGGADSTALAAAVGFEAPRVGLRAGAVVVDHGLQAESAAVADGVSERIVGLGLDPVEVVRVVVGTAGGPEAAARTARYGALDAAADRLGAVAVLLGHTLDDQAETVLLGLGRGSGTRSIAGMRSHSGRYVRPLLGVPRSVTRQCCADLGLPVWDDPHNDDDGLTRVRVRKQALPALEAAVGPGVRAALARTAAALQDDDAALEQWADAVLEAAVDGEQASGLDAAQLATVPPAVRRRVLRRMALAAGVPAGALTAEHLHRLDDLVARWSGQGPVDLPGGITGARHCGRLYLAGGQP